MLKDIKDFQDFNFIFYIILPSIMEFALYYFVSFINALFSFIIYLYYFINFISPFITNDNQVKVQYSLINSNSH
jgi:hypothetical protein